MVTEPAALHNMRVKHRESHCLFSCSTDLLSSSSRAFTAFTIVAWKSSAPLKHTQKNIKKTQSSCVQQCWLNSAIFSQYWVKKTTFYFHPILYIWNQNTQNKSCSHWKALKCQCSSVWWQNAVTVGFCRVPGCEDLRCSDICHYMEEVVAHEYPSLQQQEGEADAVPDYPCFIFGKLTVVSIGWMWHKKRIYL